MNKIIRENYPAADLPEDLRPSGDPSARVRIIVEEAEERPQHVMSLEEIWALRRAPSARRKKSTLKSVANEMNGMTSGASRPPSVYLDTNSFIYFVEGENVVANRLRPLFERLRSQPGTAATSELTLAEVLPKARPDVRRYYLNMIIWSDFLHLEPIREKR